MKRKEREWMYQRFEYINKVKRPTKKFVNGVGDFMRHAKAQQDYMTMQKLNCPCMKCKNTRLLRDYEVRNHIIENGFCPNYYKWVCHGEKFDADDNEVQESVVVAGNTYQEMAPKHKEKFIPDAQMAAIQDLRNTESFKKRAATQMSNRRISSEEDGKLVPTYHGGPGSILSRAKKLCKESQGHLPDPAELFFETHSKLDKSSGERELTSKKAFTIYGKYHEQLNSSDSDVHDSNDAWLRVAGTNKGNVYGLGSSQSLYYQRTKKAPVAGSSQKYESSMISQLASKNKELKERLEEFEKRLEKEREERLRSIEELKNMFYNEMSRIRPRDPRDPGDGGGASASFPVY